MFKDLKQGPDESVEVFLIKVRRSFLLATRNNEPSRVHLNTELVRQAVEGLSNTAVQREVVGLMDIAQSPPWEEVKKKIVNARTRRGSVWS